MSKREKFFGFGRPRPLDRNAKVRIMTRARALSHRTAKGRAYGSVTAKALAVLEVLLWGFHNARTGYCFPSYESIAARARCARSTVAASISALEAVGLLTWCNRIKRVREPCPDLLGDSGWRWRVVRTSNGYQLLDPFPAPAADSVSISSKSDFHTGTEIQDSSSPLDSALSRFSLAFQRRKGRNISALLCSPGSP